MNKTYYLIFIVFTVLSCKSYDKLDLPEQNGIQGSFENSEEEILKIAAQNKSRLEIYTPEHKLIKGGDDLKWGLAISGGGIRSASYNYGAIKALYDTHLLDSIQIISSVSGGGYLSYGLYTKFYANKDLNKPFGYFTFDNNHYLKNVVELQNKSKFIPNSTLAAMFLSTPTKAFEIYRSKIKTLHSNGMGLDFKIDALTQELKNNRAPFFIINTTVASAKNQDWLSSAFEFTPLSMGNPEIGYSYWDTNNTFNWLDAITISAANMKFKLLREIPNYSNKIEAEKLGLSDGGHSENLAAISLIRRGVKNIIVLDASHNVDYDFFSYKRLKRNIKDELNLDLSIKDIDNFIASGEKLIAQGVFKGTISSIPISPNHISKPLEINIYFLKMSLSKDTDTMMQSNQEEGKLLNDKIINQICTKFNKNGRCKTFDTSKLHDFSAMHIDALSKYWVQSYANHINNQWVYNLFGYKFPHTTTKDQTFYRDQLVAFIGLGYLQGLDLKQLIIDN